MKKIFFSVAPAVFVFAACSSVEQPSSASALAYPQARKVDTVDTYFGTKVPDPYRWLEDDNSDSTKKWVDAENKLMQDYISKIPFRDKIKERLKQVWNFEKMSAPYYHGKKYFYSKNDGMQNQAVLYYKNGVDAEGTVLLDPNQLAADGTRSK